MAKRDKKPTPEEVSEPLEVIFEGQAVDDEEPLEDLSSITSTFLGDKPEVIIEEISLPRGSPSLDEYIRNKVLEEMYGTTTPSEYDKISLALKRKL